MVKYMDIEDKEFEDWWRENRQKLIKIYNQEMNIRIAVMDIASSAWEGCLECQNKKEN